MLTLFFKFILGAWVWAETKTSVFGENFQVEKPLAISEAVAKLDQKNPIFDGQLAGQVQKVCEKKGCWMILKSETQQVRITFKDYGFFVPTDLQLKSIVAKGRLEKKQLSLKEAKHYAKDAGLDPKAITESPTEYHFVASGVKLVSESN